jgi:hypothetical protein
LSQVRISWFIVFIVLGALACSLLVNAPGIFIGFGLADVVLLLASWLYPPLWAAVAVFGSMALAVPILLATQSMFLTVAVLHLVVRPLFAYAASWIRLRRGLFASSVFLFSVESLVAVLIAILYYGGDGIETGLVVFGLLLAPYAYLIYVSLRSRRKVLGFMASVVALLAYYFALYAFPAAATGALAVVALVVMLMWTRRGDLWPPAVALALSVIGLALGGDALSYNFKTALYPFQPASWSESRWAQVDPGCPPTHNVFENTYSPARLRIVKTCAVAVGEVTGEISISGDGDFTFNIEPRPENASMLSIGSIILRHRTIHIEVVPADQEKVLGPIGGVCPGDVVKITGVFVIDTDHGMHSELHPAYKIEILSRRQNATWPQCIINIPPELRGETG